MKTVKCQQCGKIYEVATFSGWKNDELCNECFNIVVPAQPSKEGQPAKQSLVDIKSESLLQARTNVYLYWGLAICSVLSVLGYFLRWVVVTREVTGKINAGETVTIGRSAFFREVTYYGKDYTPYSLICLMISIILLACIFIAIKRNPFSMPYVFLCMLASVCGLLISANIKLKIYPGSSDDHSMWSILISMYYASLDGLGGIDRLYPFPGISLVFFGNMMSLMLSAVLFVRNIINKKAQKPSHTFLRIDDHISSQ